jgi:hypothetical protein
MFIKLIAIIILVVSLVQPWWSFYGSQSALSAEKSTDIYLAPNVIIESMQYGEKTYVELAEIPEQFAQLLSTIVSMVLIVCGIIGASIICKFYSQETYSSTLLFIALVILVVIFSIFYMGASKLTELGIGAVQGEETVDISIHDQTVQMDSHWGFTLAFYGIIFTLVLLLIPFLSEIKIAFSSSSKRNSN